MLLEELILNDYGTIPKAIGCVLLKHNNSTFSKLLAETNLSNDDLSDGLAFLIQRRIVKFFIFEKTYKYHIIKDMIIKRLYFPIYTQYITQAFSSKHAKYFTKIMINGTLKEQTTNSNSILDDLKYRGIVKVESFSKKADAESKSKMFKSSSEFLIINYDALDQKVFEAETINYIRKRYNEAAAEILRSLLKCDTINRKSIIQNLESTKILISDHGALVNEKDNINEYLKYLCSCGVIKEGVDCNRQYFFNTDSTALKMYRISLMIKDKDMRRILNMILDKPNIEDKDITIRSLLGINKVKSALLSLQKLGVISQKCIGDYSVGSRIEHAWAVDAIQSSLSMAKRIEKQIYNKLEKIEKIWGTSYQYDVNSSGVWISDLISLAKDHLILKHGYN